MGLFDKKEKINEEWIESLAFVFCAGAALVEEAECSSWVGIIFGNGIHFVCKIDSDIVETFFVRGYPENQLIGTKETPFFPLTYGEYGTFKSLIPFEKDDERHNIKCDVKLINLKNSIQAKQYYDAVLEKIKCFVSEAAFSLIEKNFSKGNGSLFLYSQSIK